MMMWKNIVAGVAALVGIAVSVVSLKSVVADSHMVHIEQMITGAKTAADHDARAVPYEQEAQEARWKQAEHLKRKEWDEKNPALNRPGFSWHCQQIALTYEDMAKEYEARAKMHRDMAKADK